MDTLGRPRHEQGAHNEAGLDARRAHTREVSPSGTTSPSIVSPPPPPPPPPRTHPSLPPPSPPASKTESLAALMMETLPARRWVVEGLLTPGVTLLVGKPKTGKSWLLLDLALAVASGRAALGARAVTPGRVLYLALEDTRERMQYRVRQLWHPDRDGPFPVTLDLAYAWDRLDRGGLEQLEQDMAAHPQTRLVLIDTLARIRATRGRTGQTLYDREYAEVSDLKRLAERHGVALVVCHHQSKTRAKNPTDTVSGTTALPGAADATLIFERAPHRREQASLEVIGRDHEDARLHLRWHDDRCAFTIEPEQQESGGGTSARVRLTPQQRQALDLVRAAGPVRPYAVSQAVGVSPDSGRHIIRRLARRGLIVNTAQGYVLAATPPSSTSDQRVAS